MSGMRRLQPTSHGTLDGQANASKEQRPPPFREVTARSGPLQPQPHERMILKAACHFRLIHTNRRAASYLRAGERRP